MKKTWILLVLAALLVFALAMPATAVDVTAPHCACGATTTGTSCATCKSPVYSNWQAWDVAANGNKLPTATGNYYIVADATFTGDPQLAAGTNIVIDFNGKTLTINNTDTSKSRMYKTATGEAATLTLMDSVGGGGVTANGSINGYGGLIAYGTGSTLNIYGGTYSAKDNVNAFGAAIYMKGNMNLYGGTIIGGTATGSGGGTICVEGGTLSMTGGTVKGGRATGSSGGGNLAVYGGTVNIAGGTIEGGDSTAWGGNITVNSGTVNHSAGTIKGGVAATYGGNVWLTNNSNAKYNLSGTGIITAGSAKTGGGNVGLYAGCAFTMTGGSITNGVSTDGNGWGANVHINGTSATFDMSAGTISGGTASCASFYCRGASTMNISGTAKIDASAVAGAGSGAAFCLENGTLNIKGGTIIGGNAKNGGVLFTNKGAVSVTGGTITGGTASNAGGVMYVIGTGSVSVGGGTINGGTAKYGAAIAVEGGTFTMSNGTLNGGTVTGSCGGAISVGSGTATISGGTITGGTVPASAPWGGGTFAVYGGTMNISGGTFNAGTAPRGNCGFMNNGTLTITGGTVKGLSKFGGTLNVSGAPELDIALGNNQSFNIPAAITSKIGISHDDWADVIAVAASKAVADASMPYLGQYPGSLVLENDTNIRMAVFQIITDGVKGGLYSPAGTLAGGANVTYRMTYNMERAYLKDMADGTVVDLNGFTLTLTDAAQDLSNIILVDSSAAEYTAGTGKISASNVSVAPKRAGVDTATKYRYVTMLQGGNYTAHRIYVGIKSAVLAPSGPSVNFRTILKCDEVLAAKISQYGAQFTGTNTVTSASTNAIASGSANTNEWITTLSNASAENFEKDFTSYAFFTFADDMGTATIQSSSMARSIKAMFEYADTKFASLNDYQKNALVAMYQANKSTMANGWAINNIVTEANGGNSTT